MTATLTKTSSAPPHPDTVAALASARDLIRCGVPVFVAKPAGDPSGGSGGTGFWLPNDWQLTEPNEAVLDGWRPGYALCAVMGQGLDLVDHDPRSEKGVDPIDALVAAGELPEVVAQASTPSGGSHRFVRSMGVATPKSGVLPGLDVKAGLPDGSSRGFAFIAPTERVSKATGQPGTYVWTQPPPSSLDSYPVHSDPALALARRIREAKAGPVAPGVGSAPPTSADAYATAAVDRAKHKGPIPEGTRHDTLVSYAGWLRALAVPLDLAEILMLVRLRDCAQPPEASSPVTEAEALRELRDVYRRYEGGTPDLAPVEVDEHGNRVNPLREHLLDETGVMAMQRPECLIEGTLDRGTVTVVSARFGAFKSFLLLDWLLSVAYGVPWHGRNVVQGPVLYVVAEGAWGQGERVRSWKAEHGITEIGGNFNLLRVPVQLGESEQVDLLCELVADLGAVLTVVDTFGKSTRGIEENSNTQIHLAMAALERVRDATPDASGAVVTAHHSEKNPNDLTGLRSSRGAGAIEDDVDTVYHLTKHDDGSVAASREKRKDGPREDVFVMTSREVEGSLVLDYADSTAQAVADAKVPAQRRGAERNITRVRDLLAQGKALDAPSVAARLGVSEPTARGYLRELVEGGEVQVGGDERHRYYSLAPP